MISISYSVAFCCRYARVPFNYVTLLSSLYVPLISSKTLRGVSVSRGSNYSLFAFYTFPRGIHSWYRAIKDGQVEYEEDAIIVPLAGKQMKRETQRESS